MILRIDREQAIEILYGNDEQYTVISDDIVDTTRWSEIHDIVLKDKITGRFYVGDYSCGATESQDESPWEGYEVIEFEEAEPVEVVRIEYHVKKG